MILWQRHKETALLNKIVNFQPVIIVLILLDQGSATCGYRPACGSLVFLLRLFVAIRCCTKCIVRLYDLFMLRSGATSGFSGPAFPGPNHVKHFTQKIQAFKHVLELT